jgi:hypothetical protein
MDVSKLERGYYWIKQAGQEPEVASLDRDSRPTTYWWVVGSETEIEHTPEIEIISSKLRP